MTKEGLDVLRIWGTDNMTWGTPSYMLWIVYIPNWHYDRI